jgi:hypothetical protein
LDRASGFEPEGREFESLRARDAQTSCARNATTFTIVFSRKVTWLTAATGRQESHRPERFTRRVRSVFTRALQIAIAWTLMSLMCGMLWVLLAKLVRFIDRRRSHPEPLGDVPRNLPDTPSGHR